MSLTKNEFFVGSVLFFYLTVSVMVTSKPSPTLKHVIIRQYDNMYVLLPLGDKLPLEWIQYNGNKENQQSMTREVTQLNNLGGIINISSTQD